MSLPTGTVTFLFTDIEGSTRLWEEQPDAMSLALARHNALVGDAVTTGGGHVFKTTGDGICAAFETADQAVCAALAAQIALHAEPWGDQVVIRVRMAVHTGGVEFGTDTGDYYGQSLNRLARLLAIGHGGQILLSDVAHGLCRDKLPAGCAVLPLGEHRLKDLGRPESVFQLCHSGLPSGFPPLRSLENPALKHNLPLQVTSLIGREKELAAVTALLDRSRLVTLTGSGGCGKTRLALHVGTELLHDNIDGVWLVELAAVTDSALVPRAVADALRVKEAPGKHILDSLIDYLKQKDLLLILDNCEHQLDSCARVVDSILHECSQIHILTTSREGLGIAGETTYRVPSLSLPDVTADHSPASIAHFEAVRLFTERAVQAQPGFCVTNQNARAIASVCCRLDGIPLAIELAAARARSMPIEQIEQRLDQRFRLLTGGSRTSLPRQQTLQSMIDWSYDLLHEADRALLRRLSVFAGGWTLEAAEKVCAGDGISQGEVLDLLTSLCDKSLVIPYERDCTTRYRLLETVRAYARDRQLEAGDAQAWLDRHMWFFVDLVEEAEPELTGSQQGEWLERLQREHENLRASLDWSLAGKSREAALRLCGALQRYWWTRGYLSEGREWCKRSLGLEGANERTSLRARALNGAGRLAYYQGDYDSARDDFVEGLSIMREIEDRPGIALSLHNMGSVSAAHGNYASARVDFEESLAIRRELGDRSGIAACLNNIGLVAYAQGEYASTQTCCTESLSILREIGDQRGIAMSLNNLGLAAHAQGDYTLARTYHDKSYSTMQEIGDRVGIAYSLGNIGNVDYAEGDYASARAYYEESLSIRRDIEDRWGIASSLHGLANAVGALGEYSSARAYREESLFILREIGDRSGIAISLEAVAAQAAGQEQTARAAMLWGAAETLREQIGLPLPPNERKVYESRVDSCRANLGLEMFSQAWAEGRALGVEAAIDLALVRVGESSG